MKSASVIFAAGKGSRMKGYYGNKTLLPLIPVSSAFEGKRPLLIEVFENLPYGPKAVVVNYRKEDIISALTSLNPVFCEQPVTNGTGGALIAAERFLEETQVEKVIITMGDVPLIQRITYEQLLSKLDHCHMAMIGFKPKDKAQYGALEIIDENVQKITEWKYWKDYPAERQQKLTVFNSGVYAFKRKVLIDYINELKKKPHIVEKERDGQKVCIEEFFITDIVEFMVLDGLKIGYIVVEDEKEVMGVDTPSALGMVQKIYSGN